MLHQCGIIVWTFARDRQDHCHGPFRTRGKLQSVTLVVLFLIANQSTVLFWNDVTRLLGSTFLEFDKRSFDYNYGT